MKPGSTRVAIVLAAAVGLVLFAIVDADARGARGGGGGRGGGFSRQGPAAGGGFSQRSPSAAPRRSMPLVCASATVGRNEAGETSNPRAAIIASFCYIPKPLFRV